MSTTKMPDGRTPKRLTLALDESGAVAIVFALTLTVMCGFAALAFDVGHLMMVRGEVQRTADAAALAGVMGLVPYSNPGPNQLPNWQQGVAKAHTIIQNSANAADNQVFSDTDGTVLYGYWLLKPPPGYVQPPLPTALPPTPAYLPEPAITVSLSRSVPLYFAPLVGVSSPRTVGATATAILPEAYQTTGIPPVAVSWDTVYNTTATGTVQIDVLEQDVKPQSNKGIAGWFNLDGGNDVPSVRINTPLTSSTDQVYLVPGSKATLMDFITQGQTIVMPIVQDVSQKASCTIIGWAAFKVDTLSANSMTGHFVNQYFDPNVVPTAGSGTIGSVAGAPAIVSP
jgi:hypothetical protein